MTRACALACRHCRASAIHRRDPRELRGAQVERFLDQVARARPQVFVLTGGDPMMRPDLLDIVASATERGIPVSMSPSATPRFVKADLCKFRDVGLKRVSLSIDGATRETHDRFRGVPGTWDRTMEAVVAAQEAGVEVQINTTFTKQNIAEFPAFIRLLNDIKPMLWSVFQLVPTGRGKEEDLLTGYQLEALFEALYELSLRVPYAIKTTEGQHYRRVALQMWKRNPHHPKPAIFPVNDGNGFVFVSHTGDIQPSGFLPLTAGNVREQELLDVYRDSPLFQQLRDPDLLQGKCARCDFRAICGGSRARAYAVTGDYLAQEPLCIYQPPAAAHPPLRQNPMLNLTRFLCDTAQPADALRYGLGHGAPRSAAERKPIVVWNITRRCNLRCAHCYSDSASQHYPGELTFEQCQGVVDDLVAYQVSAVLLSGGEPMIHSRFYDLAGYARSKGLRLTLSTNGTLIDKDAAARLKELGFAYVGISLDGIGATHDQFRGRTGAFEKTVAAFRHLREVGQKTGLRLTLTRHTVSDIDRILEFIEEEQIQRVCFYHLVYSGRGVNLELLQPEETRHALDRIMDRVEHWHRTGQTREVLTVDQPADGAYLWMRQRRHDPAAAERTLELLRWNGGGKHSSGTGIANIDTQGNVHPDQFWQAYTLGNVKQEPFSRIWSRKDDVLLNELRSSDRPLKGRCADCRFREICGGGFRVRAWQRYGDVWAEDPGCYLAQNEIASN